ncbi:gamma-glutamyltransferase [Paenibacillus sp. S33]
MKATEIGKSILDAGGNAVDAAIAVSYALGVLEPYSSGIGGGGVFIIYSPTQKTPMSFNYREMADSNSVSSASEIGIPGFVMGMERVHKEFGHIALKELIRPSIKLAKDGFTIGKTLSMQLKKSAQLNKNSLHHFFPYQKALETGEILVQNELSETLSIISEEGSKEFYNGDLAKNFSFKTGIALNDMKKYKVEKKLAVRGSFAGFDVYSAPLPAGGTQLIHILHVLEEILLKKGSEIENENLIELLYNIINLCSETGMAYYGDPLQGDVDEQYLLDFYSRDKKLPYEYSESVILPSLIKQIDSNNTTHLVVMDKYGSVVSVTNSISNVFGSGIYVDGYFANNQLRNFSTSNNSPNSRGVFKRPYSLIAPTIMVKDDTVIGIGSAGGQRIPYILSYVLFKHIIGKIDLQNAIKLPRFYNNRSGLCLELGASKFKDELEKRGFFVNLIDETFSFGAVHALRYDKSLKFLIGAADPRREGAYSITNWFEEATYELSRNDKR